MTIGLVLALWALFAVLWIVWPRRSRDVHMSEHWLKTNHYRSGKE